MLARCLRCLGETEARGHEQTEAAVGIYYDSSMGKEAEDTKLAEVPGMPVC
jgi:hypothetical protein